MARLSHGLCRSCLLPAFLAILGRSNVKDAHNEESRLNFFSFAAASTINNEVPQAPHPGKEPPFDAHHSVIYNLFSWERVKPGEKAGLPDDLPEYVMQRVRDGDPKVDPKLPAHRGRRLHYEYLSWQVPPTGAYRPSERQKFLRKSYRKSKTFDNNVNVQPKR